MEKEGENENKWLEGEASTVAAFTDSHISWVTNFNDKITPLLKNIEQ